MEMLFGENFSRGHKRSLLAGFNGSKGRESRNHGFAASDITLHKPVHRVGLRKVAFDFAPDAHLRLCKLKRKCADERCN